MTSPHDDATDRARATNALDVCIALDAGAGSGKTSVLVERVVALLERDIDPRSIAAITFTEKAAGELVARVRDSLEGKLAANPDSLILARALDRFGELTISTIHSFCRDILTLESLEADFAPNTEVGDENLAEQMLIDALRVWRERLRKDRHEVWAIMEQLVSSFLLREAATTLYRYRALHDVARSTPLNASAAMNELAHHLAASEAAATACKSPDDKALTGNADFLAFLAAATQKAPTQGLLEALTTSLKPKKAGLAKNWPGTSKQAYLDSLDAIEEWRGCWREHVHGDVVRHLRAHLFDRLDARRHEDSVATFDDLLVNAARLLRAKPHARARLAARYRAILVDEVQDTDPVQAEVATLLSRPLATEGPWHASSPDAGRLFAVGDPKQSIYRFRGADVATFSRLRDVIARNGEHAALTRNFRSVPDIVAWVNATFADFPGYIAQVAQREKAALDPIVVVDASEGDEETDDVDEIDGALRHLRTLFDAKATVVDKQSNTPRPIRSSDVMILLPSWGKADLIADRFRAAGFECVVEGGDTFFLRDEVRLGMAALRALVEPADTEATVFVLRGMFGLSMEELAKHAAAGGSFRFTLPPPANGSPAVADALARLGKIHRGRGTRGLSILFDELLDVTHVTAVWAALPDGKSRLANLDKLKAMTRKAEQLTTSPHAAVEELLRIERNVTDKDIDRLDKDGDAIRVTSLFKAKGLEAPVVLLLFPKRNAEGVQHVVDHAAGTIAVRMGALKPPGWDALEQKEREHDNEERRRWMYVAATRARDQLVIVRAPPQFKPDTDDVVPPTGCLLRADIQRLGLPLPAKGEAAHTAHDALLACAGVNIRVRHAASLPPAVMLAATFPDLDAHVDALLLASPSAIGDPAGDNFVSQRANALRAAKKGCVRWRAAAGEPSAKVWRPGVSVDSASDGDVNDATAVQSVGARGGRVIHAVMERLDLARPHAELVTRGRDLAAILAAQAGLDDALTAACQNIVERILANPLVDDARKAPERWAEVPFTFSPRAGTVISGTIDLCFPLDESRKEWAVFDWKSRVPAKDDPLRGRYEAQLRRYGEAVIAGMEGVKVTRLEIVGPYPELGVQVEADDVFSDVRGDLVEALRGFLERGAPTPAAYDDIAGDGDTVIASPDLSWPAQKLAILVESTPEQLAALQAIGWTVKQALDEEAAALLGLLPLPPDDA